MLKTESSLSALLIFDSSPHCAASRSVADGSNVATMGVRSAPGERRQEASSLSDRALIRCSRTKASADRPSEITSVSSPLTTVWNSETW